MNSRTFEHMHHLKRGHLAATNQWYIRQGQCYEMRHFSLKTFYFEVIIDLQEVTKTVQKGSLYCSPSLPHRSHGTLLQYNIKTMKLTIVWHVYNCVISSRADSCNHLEIQKQNYPTTRDLPCATNLFVFKSTDLLSISTILSFQKCYTSYIIHNLQIAILQSA